MINDQQPELSEEVKCQMAQDESIRGIQYAAYNAGWYAATSHLIKIMMDFQMQQPINPFHKSKV